jgi:DNA-binding MarR family transcriptional regulator
MHSHPDPDVHVTRTLDGLRRLVRALRASSHSAERGSSLSGAQLFVLREIAAEPGLSLGRLAARTATDPSSVSVVVAALTPRRLVVRGRDPHDGRRAVLSLSRRGQELLARAPEPVQVRLVGVLRELPARKVRSLAGLLSEVNSALGLDAGTAAMFFEDVPRRRRRHGGVTARPLPFVPRRAAPRVD